MYHYVYFIKEDRWVVCDLSSNPSNFHKLSERAVHIAENRYALRLIWRHPQILVFETAFYLTTEKI